jgi:hypothetical protein
MLHFCISLNFSRTPTKGRNFGANIDINLKTCK